jgi:serine/threonine-protein kinase
MAVHVGSVLAGRYEVTAPIATGGMGEVWQARDRTLGRIVAVKVLRSEYTGDSSFLIRFRNEARHTAALSHPNIASVYDYGETTQEGQRLAYLIMEFVEGKPLVTILAERGRLTPEQTLDVLGQAGDGLSAAHAAGMVHRDIKPGNLLVRPDGVVKLTDFGIAYARDAAPLTRTGMVVGTAQYLSPEQAQGHVVTAASDVYSLGVLGYECVAGTRPFDGESQVAIALAQINRPPPPLPPDVPRQVRALIERALTKDPAGRFPDGGAFAEAVRRVAGGGVVPPPPALTQVVGGDHTATAMIPVGGATAGGDPATAPRMMPPLHGPPVDDDGADGWADDAVDDPQRRRRTRLIWVAAAMVLLLLVAVGVAVVLAGGNHDRDGDTASPSGITAASTSAPAGPTVSGGIAFNAGDYVGEPADDVQAELEGLGFTDVQQEDADADQLAAAGVELAAGEVATASPAQGTLAPDSTITLYVAPAAFSPATEGEQDGGQTSAAPSSTDDGGATQTTPRPSPTTPTTTTAPAPPPPPPTAPTTVSTTPSESPSSSPTVGSTTSAPAVTSTQAIADSATPRTTPRATS